MTALLASVDRFDARAERLADHLRGKRPADLLFYAASALGDHGIAWAIVAAMQVGLDHNRAHAALRLVVALLIESLLVNIGIKSLFRRTRPVFAGDRPLRLRQPRSSSFPSGHSTSAFMALILASDGQIRFFSLYLAIAIVIAYSRIHVRIHHASDVAGGVILGLLFGLLIRTLFPL